MTGSDGDVPGPGRRPAWKRAARRAVEACAGRGRLALTRLPGRKGGPLRPPAPPGRAPIRVAGHPAGVVCHEHVGRRRVWRGEEQNFAGSIADLVSVRLQEWEKEQAEKALLEARRHLEQLVSSTPAVLYSRRVSGDQ